MSFCFWLPFRLNADLLACSSACLLFCLSACLRVLLVLLLLLLSVRVWLQVALLQGGGNRQGERQAAPAVPGRHRDGKVRHPTPPHPFFLFVQCVFHLFFSRKVNVITTKTGSGHKRRKKETKTRFFSFPTVSHSPAPLYDLGVTPIELASKVGPAGLHCPVSLTKNKLLIDCTLRLDMVREKRFLSVLASASLY
eukprot:COSAG06_NODE_3934_length_4749_cov_430.643656_3_plen_195_part_00